MVATIMPIPIRLLTEELDQDAINGLTFLLRPGADKSIHLALIYWQRLLMDVIDIQQTPVCAMLHQ
jgi:hypothetical protein